MLKNRTVDILYYICNCIDFLNSVLSKFHKDFHSFLSRQKTHVLNGSILGNDQLDTKLLYFTMGGTFIMILYTFRALYAHHQEVELY